MVYKLSNARIKVIGILSLICTFFAGIQLECKGQNSDNQLWLDYNLNVQVTPKFSYGVDAGIRGLISNEDWNQVLIRPGVKYRFSEDVGIGGSLAYFHTFNKESEDVYEFRLTTDLNIEGPDLLYVILFYRLRLENRTFFYDSLPNENNWRGRLLIGVETWNFKGFNEKRFFYFRSMWEGFKTIGEESAYENLINQMRIYVAYGHKISKGFRYELQYIWQKSKEYSDDGDENSQGIIRLRAFHRIGK